MANEIVKGKSGKGNHVDSPPTRTVSEEIARTREALSEKPSEKAIVLKPAELSVIFTPDAPAHSQGAMKVRVWKEEHGSFPTIWDPRAKGETRFGIFETWKDVPSKGTNSDGTPKPPFKAAIFAPLPDAPDAHLGPFSVSGTNLTDKLKSVSPGDECAISFLGRVKIDNAKAPMKQFRVAIARRPHGANS